ncbi:hypothetical protein V8F20_009292 [Naviculisporaceae sp. PSN 640]
MIPPTGLSQTWANGHKRMTLLRSLRKSTNGECSARPTQMPRTSGPTRVTLKNAQRSKVIDSRTVLYPVVTGLLKIPWKSAGDVTCSRTDISKPRSIKAPWYLGGVTHQRRDLATSPVYGIILCRSVTQYHRQSADGQGKVASQHSRHVIIIESPAVWLKADRGVKRRRKNNAKEDWWFCVRPPKRYDMQSGDDDPERTS